MILDKAHLQRLSDLHRALMRLHKILLDDEKAAFEKIKGPIESPGKLLDLVMHDPWFDWLHRISHLIIRIDEVTESKESQLTDAHDLLETAQTLVLPTASDVAKGESDFMKKYKSVLQRNSAAVNAHAEVLRVVHMDRH